MDRAGMLEIARIAEKHDLIVISDEAYEHLWFDDNRHIPIATLPGMWERTVTVGSGGKSFSFTGWKVGWVTGPAPAVAAVVRGVFGSRLLVRVTQVHGLSCDRG